MEQFRNLIKHEAHTSLKIRRLFFNIVPFDIWKNHELTMELNQFLPIQLVFTGTIKKFEDKITFFPSAKFVIVCSLTKNPCQYVNIMLRF